MDISQNSSFNRRIFLITITHKKRNGKINGARKEKYFIKCRSINQLNILKESITRLRL
jgi:hypothetical protein